VSRFLPTRELSNNRIIQHRTTSAKTRATATLRQRHIPPNVRVHYHIGSLAEHQFVILCEVPKPE